MLRKFCRHLAGTVAAMALGLALPAGAAAIQFEAVPLGGNTWQYNYSVTNESPDTTLFEFTVFFDRTLYGDLAVAGSPAGWDALVVQPDLLLPDDGFFDALALADGVAPSTTLTGFAVQFAWLGVGTPGPQAFAIVDPATFATLEVGTTSAVPAPAAAWLLATAAGTLAFRRRAARRS